MTKIRESGTRAMAYSKPVSQQQYQSSDLITKTSRTETKEVQQLFVTVAANSLAILKMFFSDKLPRASTWQFNPKEHHYSCHHRENLKLT
jgi:hypothetical protein